MMQVDKELKIDWKKILIVGNRSYKNLWDELILLGTINLLIKQKKNIYIAAYDVERLKWFLGKFVDASKINFLTEIPKWLKSGLNYLENGKLREWKEYREIDSIIIWWGEILTEENPNSYRYRLLSILPCCFSGSKIYLMWWIQLPKKELNKWLFDFLLKNTEKIYARDYECVNNIKKYWFQNIEYFMDTAYFAYDWSKIENGGKNKYIVVNLNKNAEKFLDEMIEDIKWYVNKSYDIYFVPVSKWINDEYNDIMYLEKIRWKLGNVRLKILDREEDFEKFLKIVKWAEIVFTGRLHLFMIAKFLWAKVKVYPYQKKILKMQEVLKNFNI